jgi:phosphoesterase RecJ-like protein
MNYKESAQILEKINSAQKILLSCHAHPDSDTVGSATILSGVLEKMGKQTKIICPDDVPNFLQFIEGANGVVKQRFEDFDFSAWDLYIVCDTSGWKRLFMDTNFTPPSIPVIVIDNHTSNKGFGEINLLDYETSSVCEMLFNVLHDWNIEITQNMATSLISGMLGDTGSFQFEVYKNTFSTADQLMKLGADREKAAYNLFNNLPLELIKFWGLVISKLTVDNKTGFAYVALSEAEYAPYLHIYGTRETAAQLIISKVEGTNFGFIMTEDTKNNSSVSFRSRGGVDTSKIAVSLGGGGHPGASGAWIRNTPYKEALQKVLDLCRAV